MTVSTLRPNATFGTLGTPTLVGAASYHAALSDDLDTSYYEINDSADNVSVELGDFTLPAGAVIRYVQPRIRCNIFNGTTGGVLVSFATASGSGLAHNFTSITATVPTTFTGPAFTDPPGAPTTWSEADCDSLRFSAISQQTSTADYRIYEVYADVVYVVKPVTVVTAQDGVNLPSIEWSGSTLDSDGGVQTRYEVRVFSDAQYLAGGFDPATSTATEESGIVSSGTQSWAVTNPLPDDTYRAYVRVAQTVNSALHWSDFAFDEFVVNLDQPGAPTFTATADSPNARITLALVDGGGDASTDYFEVQRSVDGGTTWELVRVTSFDAGEGLVLNGPRVVATGAYSDTADGTTHNAGLPAPEGGVLADDLFVAFAAFDGNPTITWPAGWTEIKNEAGNGSAVRVGCAWKRADGGESGTIAITTSASEGGGVRILCIRGAHATTAPEASTGVSSAAANANPDALDPAGWATENTLWIAAVGLDGNVAVSAGPANYYDFGNTRWANVAGAGIATAHRHATAASEDPGAFTHTLEDSRAFTVGVRPRIPAVTLYDYEAPNGVAVTYRARAVHDYGTGLLVASAWVEDTDTWTSTSWWLKHPLRPERNTTVRIRSFRSVSREGRQGIFQALGATHAVFVSDTRGPKKGTVILRSDTSTEQNDLDALLSAGGVLLLQAPLGQGDTDYIGVTNHTRERVVDWADQAPTFDALDITAVGSPNGSVVDWP